MTGQSTSSAHPDTVFSWYTSGEGSCCIQIGGWVPIQGSLGETLQVIAHRHAVQRQRNADAAAHHAAWRLSPEGLAYRAHIQQEYAMKEAEWNRQGVKMQAWRG